MMDLEIICEDDVVETVQQVGCCYCYCYCYCYYINDYDYFLYEEVSIMDSV